MRTTHGEPAFPLPHQNIDANDPFFKHGNRGMELRDYFAAAALSVANGEDIPSGAKPFEVAELVAQMAYVVADAMLKERAK